MADNSGQPQRKRARQACLACNTRRVKCDVTEQQPCQNCITANVKCETRQSRRGKHPRPSKKRQSVASSGTQDEEVAGAHVLASLHRDRPSDGLVEDFVKTVQHTAPRHLEDDVEIFLGEANSLRDVHEKAESNTQAGSPVKTKQLRHAVPKAARADVLIPQREVERRQKRINDLKDQGAFNFPPSRVLEGLLTAYFRWFHPCFAIVDEMNVWDEHRLGKLSPLLLQAMLFIGVLHCEEDVLEALGEGNRHSAKFIFYNRAKDLYDAEFETKKLTVIQSVFLMSFWRAGALLEKDTRHWLGVAITLAQTKALHRSQGNADSQLAKLRRRIWWSLYTRDRQCAAALGLPNRIRDEDCDFEFLEKSDFEHAFNPAVAQTDAENYASYAVGMTELAQLLGQIVHSAYLPNKTVSHTYREQMKDKIVQWKHRLPPKMQPDNDFGEPPGFHANMQHLAYNNLLLLLYRQDYVALEDGTPGPDGTVTINAAGRNTRIIEDMLSDGTMRHGQIHSITNLFNTLCVHTVQLRRAEGSTRTVAELRAKVCLHGLQELQKTWDMTNWVLLLFFQYLDSATAARLRVQDETTSAIFNTPMLPSEASQNPQQPAMPSLYPQNEIPNIAPSNIGTNNGTATATTPWSWTNEEANHFLFEQIENEFAFGEGEMLDWSPDGIPFNTPLFQSDSSFLQ